MPAIKIFARSASPSDQSSSTGISNPIYIAGIVIAGVLILGAGLWLALRYYRRRVAANRESQMGAAFLSVKGLVREDSPVYEKEDPFAISPTPTSSFSRNQLDSSIVLPDKVLAKPTVSREDVIQYHRQSGNYPSTFAPKPFSFALGAGSPRSSMLLTPSAARSAKSRNSTISFTSSKHRFSVMSSASSDITSTSGTTRKIRQLFDPVLPDEILLRLGEQLTVVQSFDDGWCVVGRESASLVHTAKSLFKSSAPEDGIEIGVVPAWCFLKPVKGLRGERPVRSTSLGITINIDGPGTLSRNDLISWSNF